jgi:hypothetical protein
MEAEILQTQQAPVRSEPPQSPGQTTGLEPGAGQALAIWSEAQHEAMVCEAFTETRGKIDHQTQHHSSTIPNPNMENATIVQDNGRSRPAVIKIDLAPRVEEFIRHVTAGVDSWEKAGQVLISLHHENRNVLREINEKYPFITIDSLEIFLHIGQRTLYPLVMLLPRQVLGVVRTMRYDAQKEITTHPVNVVTRCVGDKPVIIRKSVAKLTSEEVKRSLFSRGNRSIEWQLRYLRNESGLNQALAPESKRLTPKEVERVPKMVGRFAVRRGIAGSFIFEKTTASKSTNQRIILDGGQAVIELCEYTDVP